MKKYPHREFLKKNKDAIKSLPKMLEKRILGFDELLEDLEHTIGKDRDELEEKVDALSLELEEDLQEEFRDRLENNDVVRHKTEGRYNHEILLAKNPQLKDSKLPRNLSKRLDYFRRLKEMIKDTVEEDEEQLYDALENLDLELEEALLMVLENYQENKKHPIENNDFEVSDEYEDEIENNNDFDKKAVQKKEKPDKSNAPKMRQSVSDAYDELMDLWESYGTTSSNELWEDFQKTTEGLFRIYEHTRDEHIVEDVLFLDRFFDRKLGIDKGFETLEGDDLSTFKKALKLMDKLLEDLNAKPSKKSSSKQSSKHTDNDEFILSALLKKAEKEGLSEVKGLSKTFLQSKGFTKRLGSFTFEVRVGNYILEREELLTISFKLRKTKQENKKATR